MNNVLSELKEARASLVKLLTSAKEVESEHSYAKGYIQGLEHSIASLSTRIDIVEQNIRLYEIINKNNSTATVEAIAR